MVLPTLILLAHVLTDAVNEGFLPAARRLGLRVILLTDHAEAHRHYFSSRDRAAHPDRVIQCDVFDPIAVINEISRTTPKPVAVFSNSDHLQTSTALAAEYFGLPGKDWKTTYRTKNKAQMRAYLRERGVDTLWHAVVTQEDDLAHLSAVPFPCVAKPREGVASQLVRFCTNTEELRAHCRAIWAADPGRAVLIEDYIAGELYTLETLGDGKDIVVLGGFHVTLSPPPDFIEIEGRWGSWLTDAQREGVLRQIRAVGVGFGSCHTEFVLTPQGPRIIEINYRTVGDHMEFMLEHTLDIALFEKILRVHLGEPAGGLQLADRVAAIRYFPTKKAGKICSAPDDFLRIHDGLRVQYRSLRCPGEHISVTRSNKDYLGILSVSAWSQPAVIEAIARESACLSWHIQP
jgi:biotin carboxylase